MPTKRLYRQAEANVALLKEEDAYPAEPQDAYGWEKLVTERLCMHYADEYGMASWPEDVVEPHDPLGTWDGGREKAPAALCRKVAVAKLTGNPELEIWGDGKETRSFCYIDDCTKGMHELMRSDYGKPLNVGQDRMVTVDELADMVAEAAGVRIEKKYVEGPQGVRGRNSDNTKLRRVLGWEPEVWLEEGLARTYEWVEEQVRQKLARESRMAEVGA